MFLVCWWYRRHASLTCVKRGHVWLVGAVGPGMGPDLVLSETGLVICPRRIPRLVDCSKRMCRPVECYVELGCCGERSTSRVISLGAKTRNGGPQKPVP